MKRLIVGCGYLGLVVARRWRMQGHPVAALTRSRSSFFAEQGITPVLGDVTDPALVLPTATTVLYAVGMDRTAGKSMRDVYLGGLLNVLKVLPTPERFIYISSTSVYGQTTGEWVTETSPTEPVEESGKIIHACEQELRARCPHAIVLRFAGIYGPGRVIRRASIERGEPLPTDPTKWLNLIHVEDGATAVLQAAEQARPGATYNIADDAPVTRRDFYTTMADLLHVAPPVFTTPPEGVARHDNTHRRISNHKMREELGVSLQYPTHVEGLAHAIGTRD